MPLEVSVADQINRFRQASKRGVALDGESTQLVAWARKFGFLGKSKPHLAFLNRLRSLAAMPEPVLVLAEKGIGTVPVLKALSGRPESGAGQTTVQIDVAGEDFPARARRLLFGHRETVDKTLPALADSAIDLLVIHAPERLPAGTQRRLARALGDRAFRAPCTRRAMPVVPRVVLICDAPVTEGRVNEDLRGAGFDADLLAQVTGWTLRVPPLRERTEDLTEIIEALWAESARPEMSRPAFSSETLMRLQAHLWPGNEAELRSVLGALAGRQGSEPVQPAELPPLLQQPAGEPPSTHTRARSEKDRIVDALWRHGYNRTRAAEALGMSRKTLYNKIQKFGLAG